MRTITTTVYTIDEHPNPEKCYEWIRENWHDLNDPSRDEFIGSLNALQKEIGGELDYSISTVPCRGEYISLKGYDKEAMRKLVASDCPLTGVCWDHDIIEAIQEGSLQSALKSLHEDTEHLYSDEGLRDFLEANEYEFTEEGEAV